jgi:hypothetical protein
MRDATERVVGLLALGGGIPMMIIGGRQVPESAAARVTQ